MNSSEVLAAPWHLKEYMERRSQKMASPTPDTAAAPRPPDSATTANGAASGRRRRPQPWWLLFLVVLSANYLVAQLFFPEPSSITIPYTFFKQQVEAGNVADVTSVGDSIQGSFKSNTTYPPQASRALGRTFRVLRRRAVGRSGAVSGRT